MINYSNKINFLLSAMPKAIIIIITGVIIIASNSCTKSLDTNPLVEFVSDGGSMVKSDSLDKDAEAKFMLKCSWNGEDLLTKLNIYANNNSIDIIKLEEPTEGFGYSFKFKKTSAETDSILVELYDEADNIGSTTIELYQKKKDSKPSAK